VNSQPAPNPVVPNAVSGWREYGSTDLAGVPLDLSRRVGGYLLRADEVEAGFSNRAQVFSAFGAGEGWNPQP
jgi:pectate lyase